MSYRRPSVQTTAVLIAFLDSPSDWRYGYEMSKRLGLPSGTLYPILMRLSDRGQLETQWTESLVEGRPPRHMYRLTEAGRVWATAAVARKRRTTGAIPRPLGDAG